MAPHPIVFFPNLSVLVIKPANEPRRGEDESTAMSVSTELKGQTALGDEFLQDESQVGILKIVENRIVVGSLGTISFSASSRLSSATVDLVG